MKKIIFLILFQVIPIFSIEKIGIIVDISNTNKIITDIKTLKYYIQKVDMLYKFKEFTHPTEIIIYLCGSHTTKSVYKKVKITKSNHKKIFNSLIKLLLNIYKTHKKTNETHLLSTIIKINKDNPNLNTLFILSDMEEFNTNSEININLILKNKKEFPEWIKKEFKSNDILKNTDIFIYGIEKKYSFKDDIYIKNLYNNLFKYNNGKIKEWR
jgi:hypothetical protein